MTGPGGGRSLRWRVTALAVVVIAVALVLVCVAVNVLLAAQLRRDEQSLLDDRAGQVNVLLAAGTSSNDILSQVDGEGLHARLVDDTGRRVAGGTATATPARRAPAAGRAARPLTRIVPMPDGTRLVLAVDPGENARVLSQLRTVMYVVGGVGLVLAALVLLGGMRTALRPLESMTALARDIARGDRGRRLRPPRSDTELGRTAAAFDDMLDALETAEAHAEGAAAEARRSEATTRRFLSDAAHELRTPLSGVQSLAETLVRHPDVELERREQIATTLVRETRRAGALVADMLELARIEGGPVLERRPVELVALAQGEADRIALVTPSARIVVTGHPVGVWADPTRVTQILDNLLNNARRHGPEGGVTGVAIGGSVDGEWATLTVTDQGSGVPAEERERIFDRLVRLDDARGRDAGGAGLGLPIARALARAHGGDLVAEAPPPDAPGGRFRLTLPMVSADTPTDRIRIPDQATR